jgi:hypothetical protein
MDVVPESTAAVSYPKFALSRSETVGEGRIDTEIADLMRF